MKPGLRWDHKSRATWRPVWRLRCYRSDFLSLQEERVKYIAFFSFCIHNNVSTCMCLRQDLLRQPEIAVLVNLRLEDTPWTASRIARFLSTPSPDIPRRPGAPLTWLDIYNDINQTISTLAQVTEVLLLCCYLFLNINKIEK